MTDTAALQREMFDTIMRDRDLARLRELYHPEYSYMGGDGIEQQGADAGVAVAETYTRAFSDLSIEIRHQYTCGDDVAVLELTARGTHDGPLEDLSATGRRVEIVVCNVIEARDGKIYREREYFDSAALMSQLGVG